MPARKLAGAAMAAASNKRLMVMPPVVMETVEPGPLWAPEACDSFAGKGRSRWNFHRSAGERISAILAGRRREARIDLGPGRVEKAIGGVLRVSDESGLHRLVFGPQQEFRPVSMASRMPFSAPAAGEGGHGEHDRSIRDITPSSDWLYNVSPALICGFEPRRNSRQFLPSARRAIPVWNRRAPAAPHRCPSRRTAPLAGIADASGAERDQASRRVICG